MIQAVDQLEENQKTMPNTPPLKEQEVVEKPVVQRPVRSKKFKAEAIEQMAFKIKTEDDPVDDRGITKYESCAICKWFIEKGNYYLQLGCSHRFHKKCMEMQLLSSSKCATCGVEA